MVAHSLGSGWDAMIAVKITNEIFEDARQREQIAYTAFGDVGTHLQNKHQRMTGYIAEAAIKSVFPFLQYSQVFAYDFCLGEFKFDSKAQGCNNAPRDYFVATLYAEQKSRPADYYIFSRVQNNFDYAYICGIISKDDFFKKARIIPAGTKNKNFIYDDARYEIFYYKLEDIQKTLARML